MPRRPPTEIVSTPKHRRPYLIREEAHPLKPGVSVFRVYNQQLQPLYIGRESLGEAIDALQHTGLISSLTIVYRQDVKTHPNFQQAAEMILGPDRQGPLERLLAVIGSLVEDLKVALNSATTDGKIPGPYLRVFEQGIRDAEALLAFHPGNLSRNNE